MRPPRLVILNLMYNVRVFNAKATVECGLEAYVSRSLKEQRKFSSQKQCEGMLAIIYHSVDHGSPPSLKVETEPNAGSIKGPQLERVWMIDLINNNEMGEKRS
jgi:hypothetical protein